MARRLITPLGNGRHAIELPETERKVLAHVAAELKTMLTQDSEDEGLKRLFPPAYLDDPERADEFRSLMHDDLLARRLEQADILEQTAEATELDDEQLMAWTGAVNDLRLVLGTKLDVSEDEDPFDHDGDQGRVIYNYLGFLLEQLVNAARSTLPPDLDDGPAPD